MTDPDINAGPAVVVTTYAAGPASILVGGVLSVAGRTGNVALAEADVANLVTDLAAKATTASVTAETTARTAADTAEVTARDAAITTASTADRARANHTGTQVAATVSDFSAAADARVVLGRTLTDVAATTTTAGALVVAKHNPVDATAGNKAMTLANAASAGLFVSFEKTDATANTVTVTANIRGVAGATNTLTSLNDSRLFVSKADGSWWPVAVNRTNAAVDAAADARITASRAPSVSGRARGLKYDGTDETATMNTILASALTAGPLELVIEGMVRCDGQITLPYTQIGTVLRMPPLRITGELAADASGAYPPFPAAATYPAAPGLDLRYAGRSDTGCVTVLDSAYIANTNAAAADRGNLVVGAGIPDRCWILAVKPGAGWITTRAARAAGTVTLKSFGGRIQGFGYGALEIDHLQLVNLGAATSAPFGLTTGPSVRIHDNLFAGHTSKTYALADEDPWVFGGPGQGTYLTTGLTASTVYTSLTVAATPVALLNACTITLNAGSSNQQTVVTSGAVAVGATTIPVNSFTAAATFPADTSAAFISGAYLETTPTSYNVPSAPFQGYASHFHDNHLARCRRILAGGYATDIYIDDNAWMHDCGSNLAVTKSTLTTALVKNTVYTTLAVTALSAAVVVGDVIQVGIGTTSQETVAAAAAAVGATSVTVTSFTANAAYATGTKVFNTTAGIGAMIESYAIGPTANTIVARGNRMGFSGGYTHATRFAGSTIHSNVLSNNFQDFNSHVNNLAGHRFERNATANFIMSGLASLASSPLLDDWSTASGLNSQFSVGAGAAQFLKIESINHIANSTPAGSSAFKWQDIGVDKWQMYQNSGSSSLFLRDLVNGVMSVQYVPGSTNTGGLMVAGFLRGGSWIGVQAVATGSRGSASGAGAGAMIYDSTLSKPIWSDGTTWRDATGAIV